MDKIMIVTGGSRGIGAAAACGYGARVNYRQNQAAAEALQDLLVLTLEFKLVWLDNIFGVADLRYDFIHQGQANSTFCRSIHPLNQQRHIFYNLLLPWYGSLYG
ncbi:MAG: hypothetical protein F6K31_39165 [Symploca sp. SIO2G7]|nr:hypothetical protein [Symploca sp. SIO2G7]